MDLSLLEIQKNYNDFQDTVSEIDHYNEESNGKFDSILEYCTTLQAVIDVGAENIEGGESASSSTINKENHQKQLTIGVKEPIDSIKSTIELINNKLNKMNNLLENSKKLVHFNNINDLNLISNRGKSKLELSICDLIEFMTITYNNYEQDYQMKQILFDDIKEFKNGTNINITIDKLNNTVPMWQSKPLIDNNSLAYITQRIQLFNSILKLSK